MRQMLHAGADKVAINSLLQSKTPVNLVISEQAHMQGRSATHDGIMHDVVRQTAGHSNNMRQMLPQGCHNSAAIGLISECAGAFGAQSQ